MLPAEVVRAGELAQREHWGRVLAATMRLARDLDIAEEATRGVPAGPADLAGHRDPGIGQGLVRTLSSTDRWWPIAGPSPTMALGRCLTLSYEDGPAAGLADLDEVMEMSQLDGYCYAHAARAHLLERLGRQHEARRAWVRAATTARTDAERRFFQSRAGGAVSGALGGRSPQRVWFRGRSGAEPPEGVVSGGARGAEPPEGG